ncbi:MAG: phosphate ABC transporter permease PstA [Clostridiales bacterium]|nr:phosphate ABC transporter permease PstA [Clostridiales bacterium]
MLTLRELFRVDPVSFFLRLLVRAAAAVTALLMTFLVGYILIRGAPHITPDLFAPRYTSENVSLLPALVNTVLMAGLSLALAVPFGVCAAIWLAEYAKRGNKLVAAVRLAAETLSGIPSIIYGLFGMLMFVMAFGWGYSLLSGAFTLAIMILPLMMRATEEALLAVPDMYREGSFGLGAGKLRTVFSIVLPAAAPGILAGVILSTGRIVGETAALIFTAGTVAELPKTALSSTRTLSVHLYILANEGFHTEQAYATAVVLLLVVLGINGLSAYAAKRVGRLGGSK